MAGNYNSAEVMSMQQDALRRVREMQRRASEKLRQTEQSMGQTAPEPPIRGQHSTSTTAPPSHQHPPQPSPPRTRPNVQQAAPAVHQEQQGQSGSFLNFFDKLGIDREKGLLLLLIILLLNEGADTKLILALCYLLI